MKTLTAYVQGVCQNNHQKGKGGWAAVISGDKNSLITCISGSSEQTTSMRMKLTSAIKAIECLDLSHPDSPILIKTSSKRLIRIAVTRLPFWADSNWRDDEGKLILDQDLWRRIHELCATKQVVWLWDKPHFNSFIEKSDRLAKEELRQVKNGLSLKKDDIAFWDRKNEEDSKLNEMNLEQLICLCDSHVADFFSQMAFPDDVKEESIRIHLKGLPPNAAIKKCLSMRSIRAAS